MNPFASGIEILQQLQSASRGLICLGQSLLDLFCPRKCAGCLDSWVLFHDGFWCATCLENLSWIRSPLCPCCGRPYLKSASPADHLCGDCLINSPFFHSARSAVQHSGEVRDRVNQLKFGAQLHWVPPLADLLARTIRGKFNFDLIIPVPLHPRRLRQRGFNQAGLIAGCLGRNLNLPVRFDILRRSQWTDPQTRLSRSQRLLNVKEAFSVDKPEEAADCRVLLLDDVFTTGTTLNECSKTLVKAGVAEVHAVTVTRALPDAKGEWE
jgi:ComF family protein